MKIDARFSTPTSRCGVSVIELIVTATLMVTLLGVVAPLGVKSQRLWRDSRHYQLALDELANQIERLTTLDAAALETALAELTPSEPLRNALASPVLTGETIVDSDGRRLVLHLQWDRIGQPRPLTLVAWLAPPATTFEEPTP